MDIREPGLFRKGSMKLTIYVDDSLLAGPVKSELEAEMKMILARFPGKVIPPEILSDGTEKRDLLGVTLLYNRKK
ncbi:MAG: hypothetical protein CMB97_00425 [Flavobacteriaceae bacterium]|nr:hypothetical protein [Flavobacteriaceae bacterium]